MKAINTAGLIIVSVMMVMHIMSAPVPAVHTKVECIPIGAAAEAQTEYERVGNWVIRR